MRAYLATASTGAFRPPTHEDLLVLLEHFLLATVVANLSERLDTRPRWAGFASAGLLDTSKLTISVAYPDVVTVTHPTAPNSAGSRVDVTVTYPYDPLVTFFNSILGTTMGSTSEGIITY